MTAPVIRVALAQQAGVSGDIAGNLGAVRAAAAEAAGAGAAVIVFPELFLTGYNIGALTGRLAVAQDSAPLRDVGAIAAQQGIAIVIGYPERAGTAVHNSAALFDRTGRLIHNHRKLQLYGREKALFSPGDRLGTVMLDGARVGLLICYDVEFPEAVRRLARAGAELVLVPTALMEPAGAVARLLIPARAFENQVFVAYANRCGTEGDLTYCGLSRLAAPDGSILAAGGGGPALLLGEADLARCAEGRVDNPYLADRRGDLYD